ncbi:MAG: ComF family protein [Candidatus Paceibacterota bacterium]|jgi:competence protein ComFC
MSLLSTILEVFFPSRCLSCGEKNTELCTKCLNESPGAERESAKWVFPLYDYRHPPIKKSIALLKYKGKKRIAEIFGEVLYDKILEEVSELAMMENFRESILVPIPLSRKRLHERGYNQAELSCKQIIKINNERSGINTKLENGILIKIKDEKHQAHLSDRRERLENIVGSFVVKNPEMIKNKNIILIDDVTTTGATLEEAKKTLKKSGSRKVIAFTIAH